MRISKHYNLATDLMHIELNLSGLRKYFCSFFFLFIYSVSILFQMELETYTKYRKIAFVKNDRVL